MNKKSLLGFAAVLCLLPACGVGGAIAASAGGGGGGGGSSTPPPPPTVSVSLPDGDLGANLVSFNVRLADPRIDTSKRDPRVRIFAEFQPLNGIGEPVGDFQPMTEARIAASEGTRDLELSTEHSFVWNSIVDVGAYIGPVRFRFSAQYEDAEGIKRRFIAFTGDVRLDNRLAGTLLGGRARADSDLDTFPIDLRPDGDGFLVADLGANIVERVGATGRVDRVVGLGVPGSIPPGGQAPGVARLPLLFGLDKDPAGNLYTTHNESIVVTNRGATSIVFGLLDELGAAVPDTTVVLPRTAATVVGLVRISSSVSNQLGPPLSSARAMRRHPSGALLLVNLGSQVLAFNSQDPSNAASTPIVLGGVSVAPGEVKTIFGGGASTADGAVGTDAALADVNSLAVGPDGEIYACERTGGRVVVFNAGAAPITVDGSVVAPGTVRTVAGGVAVDPGATHGDGGPPTSANLLRPSGIDVSAQRVLYIADTNHLLVRAANLGTATVTFAETVVAPHTIETVVGGGSGGIGSPARGVALQIPNNVTLDTNGNLLVADGHRVLFVNGTTATVSSYGATAGAGRVAEVYDATERGGLLLVEPRAVLAATPETVYFTDRSSVRVMNLAQVPLVFGGASADPGDTAIVGGGAVAGFAGDGGPGRGSAFSGPSALATEGPFLVYVADTDNHRVRVLNTDDPRLGPSAAHTALGVSVPAGNVDTVVGGATGPLPADGDGLAPRSAVLSSPQGLAVSNAGLLFVADTGHHRIRCVNPGAADVTVAGVVVAAGTIRTVVGGGVPGFTPDGAGPWLVDSPTALAVDRDLLYFADSGNARIRVLNISAAAVTLSNLTVQPGRVLTICGNGTRGNAGDFGLGVDAQIDTPRGFALQTLNGERAALYFADGPQHVVRMLNLSSDTDLIGALDPSGGVAITVPDSSIVSLAGGPNAPDFPNAPGFDGDGQDAQAMRFSQPWGVAVTTFGGRPANFFVADSRNQRLRRFGAPPLVAP